MSPKNARLCFVDKPKLENKQQSKFEKMLGMQKAETTGFARISSAHR